MNPYRQDGRTSGDAARGARVGRVTATRVLALAGVLGGLALGACSTKVPMRSQGASVRAPGEPTHATTALASMVAPAWANGRNDAALNVRHAESVFDQMAFARVQRPDAMRPRRVFLSTQDNTLTFFRLEGVQFRERSSRVWVP